MEISQKDIEQIMNAIPDPYEFMDFLAPQEITRLAELISNTIAPYIEQLEQNAGLEFASWSQRAKQEILVQIELAQTFFGVSGLETKIQIDELLKQVYQYEMDSIHNNK